MTAGYGYGYGYGDGDGNGDGVEIGATAGHAVQLLTPWPVVRVGCQVHSLQHWREIASEQGIKIDEEEVQQLLDAADGIVRGMG